ncbi:MAG: hypothetical protein H3C54_01700 [Taibaiella sp.]|nr:hypothetical protein [Taibaiella sp.]
MRQLLQTLAVLLLPLATIAQETTISKKQIRKERPKYLQVGLGLNRGSLRDFATSPITYKGILFNYSIGYLKMDTAREVKFTARFNNGVYRYKRKEGIDVKSRAGMYVLYLNYYRLYRLNKISNSNLHIQAGGMFDANLDFRINDDLMNAGYGYEFFNTFFLSGKVTRRWERTETVHKKFLFIKYKRNPRVAMFSYQLNLPVMHNSLRNGFAYIGNEGLNTSPAFKEYEYKAFGGIRFSSELAYTRQMQNGNMWRISYLWDAYTSGKGHNRFELSNHIAEVSLLFHLNKNTQ